MKKTHISKGSNGSTYPLPSLCSSSMTSRNSSTKSLPLVQQQNGENDVFNAAKKVSRQQMELSNHTKPTPKQKKRWDESQLAIELCDDSYKSIKSMSSTHTSRTAKSLKSKIFNAKLFQPKNTHHSSIIPIKLTLLINRMKRTHSSS